MCSRLTEIDHRHDAAEIAATERLVDRLLSCDGDKYAAFEAGKEIHRAAPSLNSNKRVRTVRDVDDLFEPTWVWLSEIADSAHAGGADLVAGKIALACYLWNRMLIPEDSRISQALREAPESTEVFIYATGLDSLLRLPPNQYLAGGRRGQFLVHDALVHAATGIVLLHDKGVAVSSHAYQAALPLARVFQ